MKQSPDVLPNVTIRVRTPDGTMFVSICEYNGNPTQVLVHIGKSGHSLQAWADALARMVSLALRSGVSVQKIITEISQITTDRRAFSNGISVYSGPDGVTHGLLQYLASKRRDEGDERSSRLDR